MSQLLHVAVLWFYFHLPFLLCDNLLCYYSHIRPKDATFELVVTECPPDEVCYKAEGRFGNYSALSSRGCMAKTYCSQVDSLLFKGTVYTMSYNCCDQPYCNSCLDVTAKALYIMLTLVTVALLTS